MKVHTEILESIVTAWAKNLWLANYPGSDDGRFEQLYGGDRGLSKVQSISEQGLIGYAFAAAHLNVKADSFATNNKLVDAWRKSVFKNSFQKKYSFFEKQAYALMQKQDKQAVVNAFPRDLAYKYPDVDVGDSLRAMNYKSPLLTISVVAALADTATIIGIHEKADKKPSSGSKPN